MIELPADLAEVLKTLQSNEQGADILFPDGNEDLLAELAAAWTKWNEVADSHVVAIVEAANRAMASMSGPAADSFAQYLKKFAGGEGSHVSTTLQSGHAMAKSMQGAAQAVGDAKTEMIRELQYAKDYIAAHPAGKHDDIAKSEGVKEAVSLYHQYVNHVSGNVDATLRTNADRIADMTGMGQTCALNGSAAGGGSGAGGAGGAGAAGGPGGIGTMSGRVGANLPGGLFGTGADSGLPGGVGDPSGFSLPGLDGSGAGGAYGGAGGGSGAAGAGFSLPGLDGSGAGGAYGGAGGAYGGAGGAYGGAGGGSGAAGAGFSLPGLDGSGGAGAYGGSGDFSGSGSTFGSTGGSGLAPFSLPAPNLPDFGTDTGGSTGTPVFKPLSSGSGSLGLAGLGDLGDINTGGPGSSYTPSPSFSTGPGSGGPGSFGGSPLGNLGSTLGSTLSTLGSSGSALGSSGGARSGLAPFGGGSSPFGLGGGSARGLGGGAGGLGGGAGSALAGRSGGAGAGSVMSGAGAGSTVGRSGAGAGTGAGGATAGRTGATGAAGAGHMPGAGGAGRGGGGKGDKHGNRFVSPTRFGSEGEEDEELHGDAGILGQAGEVGPRDRHWHRARRRWLDDARADGTFTTPEPEATPVAAAPTSESEVLNQLAGVLLGGGATADGGAGTDGGSDTDGATDDRSAAATVATADPTTARQETPVTAVETSATTADTSGGADDAYLERARSAAARRGHPDAPAAAPAATAPAGEAAATAQRAPLREEGGYQVPSPFLRAALSRLAAPAAD
ncbi:hypothetical protein Kpho02_00740 [Kitasatospora phosalacinea]|uniref:Outer membrane channel protein CpnT-like N-terminal domain-containing protein n=1 Tax=Kitasatospora phosalacinea TaxID=2065 RepID=A0A9W6V0F5_9ACTN|nr:hypothetical protein [Kitasatospora phosalacinea]GLW67775.1 hypothetical protein Kpho02_00740 [Kitasatospora phosalacinea]